jgi:hypothetical protein
MPECPNTGNLAVYKTGKHACMRADLLAPFPSSCIPEQNKTLYIQCIEGFIFLPSDPDRDRDRHRRLGWHQAVRWETGRVDDPPSRLRRRCGALITSSHHTSSPQSAATRGRGPGRGNNCVWPVISKPLPPSAFPLIKGKG